jgi:hypothetical protein
MQQRNSKQKMAGLIWEGGCVVELTLLRRMG